MTTQHRLAYTRREGFAVDYGREIEEEIVKLQYDIEKHPEISSKYPVRWLAIKLLEQDEDVYEKLSKYPGGETLLTSVEESLAHLSKIFGDDVDTIIADRRYGWINGLVKEFVKKTRPDRINKSDQIDKIVTNQFLGIPIFLALMWVVFKFTTDVATPYLTWIENVINGPITNWSSGILVAIGLGGTWAESLMLDGVIAGVGGILVFIPVFIALYMALAFLEDSGYMARGAFVMDRIMHLVGLHGKSFVPLIVGFGCTVPALYATRTLDNPRDRILTGLLVPFMSCGARLPVYVLFASVFFPENAGMMVFWMYIVGIVVALLVGFLLRKSIFKTKELSPFVMELPPYRMPTFKSIWIHTWERTSSFIRKAWTVILAASILIWFLLAIPVGGEGSFGNTEPHYSAFGKVSSAIAPIFTPLGFGEWETSGALIAGVTGKELIVSTLSQVYGLEVSDGEVVSASSFGEDLKYIVTSFASATMDTIKTIPSIFGVDLLSGEEKVIETALVTTVREKFTQSSGGHGKLAGLAFMLFVLLYTPCIVSLGAEYQELGAKWMWLTVVGQFVIAWLISFIVFQAGVLLALA